MRDALSLAHQCYGDLNLSIHDVRLTRLIDYEAITLRFQVNIRVYEPAWKLVFAWSSALPAMNISLYEGHCFLIKDLDVLIDYWECAGCQQRLAVMTIITGTSPGSGVLADGPHLCAMGASTNAA